MLIWALQSSMFAATNYGIVEAACFVGEHRGGRPGPWADDVYTGVSWADVCMTARDQQDAAEAEREDLGDEDLEVNTQAPDDPPDASDESAFLDLSEFADERKTKQKTKSTKTPPKSTKTPPKGEKNTFFFRAYARKKRKEKKTALFQKINCFCWYAQTTSNARNPRSDGVFFCKRFLILVILLGGRETKCNSGGLASNPIGGVISAVFYLRV